MAINDAAAPTPTSAASFLIGSWEVGSGAGGPHEFDEPQEIELRARGGGMIVDLGVAGAADTCGGTGDSSSSSSSSDSASTGSGSGSGGGAGWT
ncbi:MAG TPA: hypothetical protein VEQ59_20245 [Polyangiaceae bacterium]|nr:hypothetical protein [Polyangiaceae bacterium]